MFLQCMSLFVEGRRFLQDSRVFFHHKTRLSIGRVTLFVLRHKSRIQLEAEDGARFGEDYIWIGRLDPLSGANYPNATSRQP